MKNRDPKPLGSDCERCRWAIAFILLWLLTAAGCGSSSVPRSASSLAPIPSPVPVLLFAGTGTSPTDVSALAAVLDALKLGYVSVNSVQLDGLSEAQLAGYKLLIVPGGNSIAIGQNLSAATAANIRNAVQLGGVHYLGVCAGAFFGGASVYNGLDLTSGVWFNFYGDENKGVHIEPVNISLADSRSLDVYWQDGPQLSGWGEVVAEFPDGTPAIVEGSSGNGYAVLTGVHLEAPASWRTGLTFTTPVSVDVAYAGNVVQAALTGDPLPHF